MPAICCTPSLQCSTKVERISTYMILKYTFIFLNSVIACCCEICEARVRRFCVNIPTPRLLFGHPTPPTLAHASVSLRILSYLRRRHFYRNIFLHLPWLLQICKCFPAFSFLRPYKFQFLFLLKV